MTRKYVLLLIDKTDVKDGLIDAIIYQVYILFQVNHTNI